MERRIALIGVAWLLSLTLILVVRLVAIDNSGALIILLPAAVGALLVLRSGRPFFLVVAAILTALTAWVLLLGGVGLLYVPPLMLFVLVATRGEGAADASGVDGWFWARMAGSIGGMVLTVALFAPFQRFSACPVRPGFAPQCVPPWTNLVGWEFHGPFPFWAVRIGAHRPGRRMVARRPGGKRRPPPPVSLNG